jgi:hypothetical protein
LAVDQESPARGHLVPGAQPGADHVPVPAVAFLEAGTERDGNEFQAESPVRQPGGDSPGDVAHAGGEDRRARHKGEPARLARARRIRRREVRGEGGADAGLDDAARRQAIPRGPYVQVHFAGPQVRV